MSYTIGSEDRPLHVAIIGAGPAGFYAAGSLIQQKGIDVRIDIFDKLPAPYGLVRYGVAPDHQKIKNVVRVYEKTARDERVRYFGNVEFGKDVDHADLKQYYDFIVYAVGSQTDRRLGIPGEDLKGSISATEFVWWYNGHPEYVDLEVDLDVDAAAVIGVGNVAIDVARILAKSAEELEITDIADYALEKLRDSRIKDIYILARRGPVQAKFTNPEIKEMGKLAISDAVVDPLQLELDPDSIREMEQDMVAARNMQILRDIATRGSTGKPRRVHFRFLCSPVEILEKDGQVVAVRIEKNKLTPGTDGYLACRGIGEYETIPVGMVLRSIGYMGSPLKGVPFDQRRGVIPNEGGRVKDPASGDHLPGEYVVGWAKRGPTGVIGTNKGDAHETAELMLADVPGLPPAPDALPDVTDLLDERSIRYVTFDDWLQIDEREVLRGKELQRPRVKLIHVDEFLAELEG